MKKLFKFALLMAILGMPLTGNAEDDSFVRNKALSAQYKSQIKILNHEIKALKVRIKANPSDIDTQVAMEKKKEELKGIKEKKSIVDNAVKTEKAAQKAAKAAEKARIKAEKAAQKAGALHNTPTTPNTPAVSAQ